MYMYVILFIHTSVPVRFVWIHDQTFLQLDSIHLLYPQVCGQLHLNQFRSLTSSNPLFDSQLKHLKFKLKCNKLI